VSAAPMTRGACCAPAAAGNGAAPARAPFRARLQRVRRAFRQVFGIPDFDRYREHMQAKHPDAPLLSEREVHAMAIDRRYGAARPRCC
jgi:uncharacterized short protein YbdD (DUF466 family)